MGGVRNESLVMAGMVLLRRQWDRWSSTSAPVLPDEWYDQLEDVLSTWEDGVESAFMVRNLGIAMKRLRQMLDDPDMSGRHGGDRVSQMFTDEFIAAYDDVMSWPMQHVALQSLPSVGDLAVDGVPHEQIARMYGLIDPASRVGRADLIAEELKRPGTVIPSDYVLPRNRETMAKRQQIQAWLDTMPATFIPTSPAYGSWVDEVSSGEVTQTDGTVVSARPSIDECYASDMSVAEAAVVTGMTVDAVTAIYHRLAGQGAVMVEEQVDDRAEDEPAWAAEMSTEELMSEAKSLGIGVRKTMLRSTLIQRIDTAREASFGGDDGDTSS